MTRAYSDIYLATRASFGARTALSLLMATLKARWIEWHNRRAYQADLRRLLRVGPHMIEDIGLTLDVARREAGLDQETL